MVDSRIRLGIVSCGYITGAHLRGLKVLREHGYSQFEVTALSSRTAENAERWIERGKGPAPLPAVSAWPNDPLNVRDVWVRDFQASALARALEPVRYTRDAQNQVVAQTACDADDTLMALLQFQSGAIGNILFSWAGHGESTITDIENCRIEDYQLEINAHWGIL